MRAKLFCLGWPFFLRAFNIYLLSCPIQEVDIERIVLLIITLWKVRIQGQIKTFESTLDTKLQTMMLISQELFDETLLESQELLEYSDGEAVSEAICELESSTSGGGANNNCAKLRLDHLSLTHPRSPQGLVDRTIRTEFVQAIQQGKLTEAMVGFHSLQTAIQKNNATSSSPEMNDGRGAGNHKRMALLACQSLLLQHDLFTPVFALTEKIVDNDDTNNHGRAKATVEEVVNFVTSMMPQITTRVTRGVQLRMTQPLQNQWFRLYLKFPSLRVLLVQWARLSCFGCEPNKKAFVQAAISQRINGIGKDKATTTTRKKNGLELLLDALPYQLDLAASSSPKQSKGKEKKENHTDLHSQQELELAKEISLLVSILGKFQASLEEQQSSSGSPESASKEPVASSAHANVLELHKCGAVPRFHRLAKQLVHSTTQNADGIDSCHDIVELSAIFLSVLRVMAIDNDIVQNMVAVGILETAEAGLSFLSSASLLASGDKVELLQGGGDSVDDHHSTNKSPSAPLLAAATLGLIRNLCANDEIKTSVCKRSLPSILQTMELHAIDPAVQEHGCGILSAMALREPDNARAIISANGPQYIIQAMRTFPHKVPLQRQGALSFRNLSSRLSAEEKSVLLDYGAENVLRDITARHQGSIDEAYAALRDLGCTVSMYNIDQHGKAQGTQMFGKIESNFRPVYDD
jgi:hypothetical protein